MVRKIRGAKKQILSFLPNHSMGMLFWGGRGRRGEEGGVHTREASLDTQLNYWSVRVRSLKGNIVSNGA